MAFEQKLRAYLERLERGSATSVPLPSRRIDEHDLHRHLLDRLRVLESAGTGAVVESAFHEWSGKLARFARYLETLPRQVAPIERDEAIAFACRVLDEAIGLGEPTMQRIDRLELQRVINGFDGGALVESYALESSTSEPSST